MHAGDGRTAGAVAFRKASIGRTRILSSAPAANGGYFRDLFSDWPN